MDGRQARTLIRLRCVASDIKRKRKEKEKKKDKAKSLNQYHHPGVHNVTEGVQVANESKKGSIEMVAMCWLSASPTSFVSQFLACTHKEGST